MLNSLLSSLSVLANSNNPTDYLKKLTINQINGLFILFIEAGLEKINYLSILMLISI
jgi:hypothetical protein